MHSSVSQTLILVGSAHPSQTCPLTLDPLGWGLGGWWDVPFYHQTQIWWPRPGLTLFLNAPPPRQAMNPAARAVAVGAWMTYVPRSLSSSQQRPPRWTPTGERWTLRQPSSAPPCSQDLWSASSWHCRDCADNPGFLVRWNCILAIRMANSLLFLHSRTMDHATKT